LLACGCAWQGACLSTHVETECSHAGWPGIATTADNVLQTYHIVVSSTFSGSCLCV
jgi:hypothetical protein